MITNTTGGPAIQFFGGPDTLTNVLGSRVIGAIDLVGVHDTVNFVGGGNWVYTFNTLAGATISTNGAPFVVSGSTVAVLDQTAFALADRSLMFFTGGVSQMLRDRLYSATPVAGGSRAMSFAAPEGSGVVEQAQNAFGGIPSVAMAYASDPRPVLGKSLRRSPIMTPLYGPAALAGSATRFPLGRCCKPPIPPTALPLVSTAYLPRTYGLAHSSAAVPVARPSNSIPRRSPPLISTAAYMGRSVRDRSFSILHSGAEA